ncbi:MAG: ABC transporter permease [Saprospiraceae bacterium]|nr:ABC transporter permease [Saprospiraceae bacterium]
MFKILKYSFYDLIRSRWTYIYCGFYLLFTLSLLWLSNDLSKVVISLMNVVLLLCPLIATMFGVMYYYNSREFTELLLAQPVRRTSIFLGQYLGVAGSLSASWVIGVGVPFALYGVFGSEQAGNFAMLLFTGVVLSFVFSAIAFFIALKNENRIKGFGLAILAWLFFAVIYDGLLLLSLSLLTEYPLEKFSLIASLLNPIDLSRILILLKLDVSALMGFTGAVFRKFLGTGFGMAIAFGVLMLWVAMPVWSIKRVAGRKDF